MDTVSINVYYYSQTPEGKYLPNLLPEDFVRYLQKYSETSTTMQFVFFAGYTPYSRVEEVLRDSQVAVTLKNLSIDPVLDGQENWFTFNPAPRLYQSFTLDQCLYNMPSFVVHALKTTNLKLIIWVPWESPHIMNHDLSNPSGRALFSIFDALLFYGINPQKVYFVDANLRTEEAWPQYLAEMDKMHKLSWCMRWNVVPIDFFAIFEPKTLQKQGSPEFFKEMFAMKKQRTKKFMCLNGNHQDFRTYIVSELQRRDALDHCYFSLVDKGEIKAYGYTGNPEKILSLIPECVSKKEYDSRIAAFLGMHKRIPISLDISAKQLRSNDRTLPLQFIEDSYITIVNETTCNSERSPMLFITEKTYKPIFYLHPFIVVGNPFILKYLRSVGYYTFPELFDESYDVIENDALRVEAILSEIERVSKMEQAKLHALVESIAYKLLHNRNLFLTRRNSQDWVKKIIAVPDSDEEVFVVPDNLWGQKTRHY